MKTKQWFLIILGVCFTISIYASGSYTPRPPRVRPTDTAQHGIDNEKYALGKKIYSGKAKLTAQPTADRAAQERRLRELQARLPAKAQAEANLPQYAGRLTAGELDALEYYVAARFPAK